MIGWIYVMEPQDYQAWLSGGTYRLAGLQRREVVPGSGLRQLPSPETTQGRGARICATCYGSQVELTDGTHVKVDEDYIRESILNPSAKIVAGYQPIMPTFQGLVTEENVLQLIEYIKS